MKPVTIGWIVFFGVPGVLWLLGAIVNRGHGFAARIFGFTVGTDNRLSLSRLQAFLWTLVIFGSFAAAMAIHKDIKPATAAEIDAATKRAKEAADAAAAKKTAYLSALAEAAATAAASNAANEAQVQAKAGADYWAMAASADKNLEAKNKTEQSKLQEAQAAFASRSASVPEKRHAADVAHELYTQAEAESKKAQAEVPDSAWVQIPATLLALAGIAIGSGVFSSLISAVGDEQQTASITAIEVVRFGNPPAAGQVALPQGPDVQPPEPAHPNSLRIRGLNFGLTKGTVRLHRNRFSKELAPVIYWHDDEIAIDLADAASYPRMTVDSPHGKLTYQLTGAHPNLQLGTQIVHYEFVDLFRDDKNPDSLSLMKFQMFGWTVIALTIYVYLFLTHLSDHIQTLPTVDSSIAILTGVSQAGYLTGKGVSNLSSNP